MRIIDVHTHTFPDKIAERAIDKLKHASHTIPFSDGTAGGLMRSMAAAGIDYSVVLPVATNPVKAASMNDVSLAKTGRDGLIYFGAIHPDTPDAKTELRRIAQAGLKGVKIHPVYQDVDIDDPRFLRILEAAGELGLAVIMHAGEDVGFPGVVRCSPEMTAKALGQVGPVKLICAHMGGWRNWERVADCLTNTSAMIDTAFSLGDLTPLEEGYYAPEQIRMLGEADFCSLVRTFGSERVLFGSDSPWSDQGESVAAIRALPLTMQEKENILGMNAARLLGL
ncbi:MAG: amidohydrolase family protein [Clostridia bacterium]|nr:amidohydrolase family protein [Clostridia bacterium]